MPEHTYDLLSCWIKRGVSKSRKRWRRKVAACIWWIIWKERNQRIFEGKECTIQKIKWKVITTPGFWCKEQDIEAAIQLVDFMGSFEVFLLAFSFLVTVFGGGQHSPCWGIQKVTTFKQKRWDRSAYDLPLKKNCFDANSIPDSREYPYKFF